MTNRPSTWPPEREPLTDDERREWLHTNPDPELCDCEGSGGYLDSAGFTWHDCPHHAERLVVGLYLAMFVAWAWLDAMLTVLDRTSWGA